MARKLTPRQVYEDLMRRHETALAEAFMAAVNDLRANADLQRLTAALEAGDVEAALRALNLDPAAYAGLREAMRAGYVAGGAATAATVQSAGVVFRFDVGNPRAETWLRDHSSQLITRIVADQREAVRSYLVDGMARGANPRTTALDIVGRINRATGRRENGVLGLTEAQAGHVMEMRRALTNPNGVGIVGFDDDGNPIRKFWLGRDGTLKSTFTRRNRNFDRTIARAIRDGTPVPAETVGRATTAYTNRLLQLRGETVARTETMTALQASRREAFKQAVDNGLIAYQDVRRRWRHSHKKKGAREDHVEMDGQTVGLDEPFIAPDGTRIMYPGDPDAGVKHTANCACDQEVTIDHLANLR